MNAARQIGKHSNPSGISMKPLGDFIVTPPRFHSNPSAAVVKPASRPRRRLAGIGAASGGSRLSSRRVIGSCRSEIANRMAFSGASPWNLLET